MKRKTAGELAEFFAAMPKDRKVMFMGDDHDDDKVELDGRLIELHGELFISVGYARYIDDLWYRVKREGIDLDEEL